jgi:alkylation response protein AidB-like acyl-CoA dehydrogenase
MTVGEAQLLDTVTDIGPLLDELGEEGERARRLPNRALDALADARLQRMFAPKSLGGLERHLCDAMPLRPKGLYQRPSTKPLVRCT